MFRQPGNFRQVDVTTLICHSFQARAACSSSCTCDLPPNWKTEELKLAFLHEVEINNFRGTEHQIALVKQLFGWAAMLKDMTINFCHSITESMARKVCQMLLSFSRPEILMNFYIYQQTTSGFVCSRGQMHRTKLVAWLYSFCFPVLYTLVWTVLHVNIKMVTESCTRLVSQILLLMIKTFYWLMSFIFICFFSCGFKYYFQKLEFGSWRAVTSYV